MLCHHFIKATLYELGNLAPSLVVTCHCTKPVYIVRNTGLAENSVKCQLYIYVPGVTRWRRGLNISTSCSGCRPPDYDANRSWLFGPDPNHILASFLMFHRSHQYFALILVTKLMSRCFFIKIAFYRPRLMYYDTNYDTNTHSGWTVGFSVSQQHEIWIKSATRRPLRWAKRKIPKICSQFSRHN